MLALAVGVVWFAPALLFFLVAEALVLLAFTEYASAGAGQRDADLRTPLRAPTAALACAAFARSCPGQIPWLSLDAVLMAGFVALAMMTLTAWSEGPTPRDRTHPARCFPALYLGLPIGAMVSIRETPRTRSARRC